MSIATNIGEIRYLTSEVTDAKIVENIDTLGFKATIIPHYSLPFLRFTIQSSAAGTDSKRSKTAAVVHASDIESGRATFTVTSLKSKLRLIQGVDEVKVTDSSWNTTKEVSLSFNPEIIGPRQIISALRESTATDFTITNIKTATNNVDSAALSNAVFAKVQRTLLVSTLLTIPVFIIAYIVPQFPAARETLTVPVVGNLPLDLLLLLLLATPVVCIAGYPIFVMAYKSLRYEKRADMDTLITLSTSIAYIYSLVVTILLMASVSTVEIASFYETAPILLVLIWFGRYMEAKAKHKTFESLSSLLSKQETLCILVINQGPGDNTTSTEDIPTALIEKGDILRINAGCVIPADGIVLEGSDVSIDESMLTGESTPVSKGIGGHLYCASINGRSSSFLMQVTKLPHESLIQDICKLVEAAQSKKAPIQGL